MTIQHEDIADPFIHEPKGVAAASADTVYVADGAGSGTWEKITEDSLNAAVETGILAQVATDIGDGSIAIPRAEVYIYAIIPDISTPSTLFIPIPEDSEIIQMTGVLEGAITTADASVDLVNAADAAILDLTVTQSGSAAGDTYTDSTPTNATITGPSYLKLSTDGASDTAQRFFVTIHMYVTRTL